MLGIGSRKISTFNGVILLLIALCFDGVGLLGFIPLGITQVIASGAQVLGGATIGVIFWFLGVNPLSAKQAIRFIAPLGIDAVTFGVLPGVTISVYLTLISLRVSEKFGVDQKKLTRGSIRNQQFNPREVNKPRIPQSGDRTESTGGQGITQTIQGNRSVSRSPSNVPKRSATEAEKVDAQ